MSAESRKVLEMLAAGKITAEEADKLLEKLNAQPSAEPKPEEPSASKPRFLRIQIDKPGQDQVNVRMPLSFARTGTHVLAVLPARIREKLSDQGIDLSKLCAMNEKDWNEAIETMNIDIDRGSGKKVKVFCE